MSTYIIELAIIHIALILGYWCFLRNEQQYLKMRLYLMGATLLALFIPLLKLPKLFSNQAEVAAAVPVAYIPMDATVPTSVADPSFWSPELLIWVYLAISGYFLLRFIGNIISLISLDRQSSYEKMNDIYVRKVNGIRGSFTFFNWVFISNEIDRNQQDYDAILNHERAHAQLGHSYDLLFLELFKVVFWWLPTSWYIRKEIKKIHDYQADARALQSFDADQYSTILISATLKLNGLALASSFHDGLISQRLKAMKQQVKNINPWKFGTLAALGTLLIFVFACTEELDNDIKKMGENSNSISFNQLPKEMQEKLLDKQEDLVYIKLNIPVDGNTSDILELADLDPSTIQSISVVKSDEAIYIAVRKEGANFDYLSDKSKLSDSNGEIFTIVEDQPEYPGGLDLFYKYVAREMRYPVEAREQGIQGRVYVQFVVDKDGSISNVEAVKGIGGGCDEEAVRVLENAGTFNPGKQRGMPVRVKMIMPVNFKLNPDNSSQGMVIVESIETNKNGKLLVESSYNNGIWKGPVTDLEGEVMAGVNIVIQGSSTGTISDLNGQFQLKANESDKVNFSFVGYESVLVERK